MKINDSTLVLNVNLNDHKTFMRFQDIISKFDAYADVKLLRILGNFKEGDALYIGSGSIFSMHDDGHRSETYINVESLDNLEQAMVDTWGEVWDMYHVIETGAGDYFPRVVEKAIALATDNPEKNSIFNFNGVNVIVAPDSDPVLIDKAISVAYTLEMKTIGPDYEALLSEETMLEYEKISAERQAELEKMREADRKESELKSTTLAEKIANFPYTFLDGEHEGKSHEQRFNEGFANQNGDGYGERCFTYAKEWGSLMQYEIAQRGLKPEDVTPLALKEFAGTTSHEADYDGISGNMYGIAVSILADTWVHGESLRKWHNKEYGNEDAKGTINPAIITIGVQDEEQTEEA